MEKYSQFRDRGSGISPFLPTTTPTPVYAKVCGAVLASFRLTLLSAWCVLYFFVLDNLPLPQVVRKLYLWTILLINGIWWVDLQLDGVKRGSLSQQPASRFPREHAVVAAQFTSPIDALYLAAIFDPIFVASYPGTRKVKRICLFRAVVLALSPPSTAAPSETGLTTIRALLEENPRRIIAVFPETTTTNGKGILPLSPSLLSTPADAKIFPVSMRYTPADVTTPVPGTWFTFLWNLLSKPTHYIRVRVAEGISNTSAATNGLSHSATDEKAGGGGGGDEDLTPEEQRIIDHIGDALARLARNRRVGLTVQDKAAFVSLWIKNKRN
ncbi:hypothetical protein GGS20DRAFT_576788 [Poronia punctata]|nr:hypothetical protein GGS20DRAFT_576788 [Poronia punctata]